MVNYDVMKPNYKAEVEALAKAFGAVISEEQTEDGWQIEVAAPDGETWDEGPGVLIAPYGGTWGPKAAAWSDLSDRMKEGLLVAG